MKIEIRESGSYIGINEKGYFESDLELRNLQDKWYEVAIIFKEKIVKEFYVNIASIVLKGSVANGKAIDNVSDIDFVIISNTPFDLNTKKLIQKIGDELNLKFPFITRFDIAFYTKDEILKIKEKVLVKLRALCIFGEDISLLIPNIYPGRDVSVTLLGLEMEIKCIRKDIEKNTNVAICKWLAKRVVRAGLELVSMKEFLYTRDLYRCWELFSKYYPDQKENMYLIMDLAINPVLDVISIKKILLMGDFLITEAKDLKLIK